MDPLGFSLENLTRSGSGAPRATVRRSMPRPPDGTHFDGIGGLRRLIETLDYMTLDNLLNGGQSFLNQVLTVLVQNIQNQTPDQ